MSNIDRQNGSASFCRWMMAARHGGGVTNNATTTR
jgi:hypothetical protein